MIRRNRASIVVASFNGALCQALYASSAGTIYSQEREEMTIKMIEIKNRFDGAVIFSGNFDTIGEAVLAAIKEKKSLRYANLDYADLHFADLRSADLRSADLHYANLRYANLDYANLRSADLRYADLHSADLRYADLSSADLSYADLRYVNLRYVNLSCANLSYADLDYSVLSFSCKSLATKFDEKHIIQIIYHAAKPTQNNELDIKDTDLKRLLKSKLFQKVANKFHRIDECGKFTGPKA